MGKCEGKTAHRHQYTFINGATPEDQCGTADADLLLDDGKNILDDELQSLFREKGSRITDDHFTHRKKKQTL